MLPDGLRPHPRPQRQTRRVLQGLNPGARLHMARHAATGLQERDELALRLRIPLDIALRHGEAGMPGELLHVPQAAPDLGHFARGAGN